MKIHWWWANYPKFAKDIISISFKEAKSKFGFLETSFCKFTLTYCFEKICIRSAKIIGQISMNNWLSDISDNLRIRIRIQNNIKINKAGCADYDNFITSEIFYRRPLIFWAYLSFEPLYRIKHILSKLLILFLFSEFSLLK